MRSFVYATATPIIWGLSDNASRQEVQVEATYA